MMNTETLVLSKQSKTKTFLSVDLFDFQYENIEIDEDSSYSPSKEPKS